MKVSIVGAGNSGCAHACKLIQCGHEVTIIKTSESLHNENYETIKSRGYIECIDHTDNLRRSLCEQLYGCSVKSIYGYQFGDIVNVIK